MARRVTSQPEIGYSIVFSGGGALGAWEVGCLEAILDYHHGEPPLVVTGASAGALNAAGVWAGFSPIELAELWRNLRKRDVRRWNLFGGLESLLVAAWTFPTTLRLSKSLERGFRDFTGVFRTAPLARLLERLFSDCSVPNGSPPALGIALANVRRGRPEYAFSAPESFSPPGDDWIELREPRDLIDALMGSSALPGLFPHRRGWLDGGVLRNQPIGAAIQLAEQLREDATSPIKVYVIIPHPNVLRFGEYEIQYPALLAATLEMWTSMSLEWQMKVTEVRNQLWKTLDVLDDPPAWPRVDFVVIRPPEELATLYPGVGLLAFGKRVPDLIEDGRRRALAVVDGSDPEGPEVSATARSRK